MRNIGGQELCVFVSRAFFNVNRMLMAEGFRFVCLTDVQVLKFRAERFRCVSKHGVCYTETM